MYRACMRIAYALSAHNPPKGFKGCVGREVEHDGWVRGGAHTNPCGLGTQGEWKKRRRRFVDLGKRTARDPQGRSGRT